MTGTNKRIKHIKAVMAALAAMLLLLLTACNDAETANDAIKRFTAKMNNCDYKGAFAYVSEYDGLKFDRGDKEGTKQIVDAVARTLQIEIMDIESMGATATATLSITSVDLRKVYSEAAAKVTNGYVDDVLAGSKISAEEMRKALVAEIVRECQAEPPRDTTTCRINLVREKEHWYIILDKTSYNVIMGHIDEANAMVESGDFTVIATPTTVSPTDISSEAPTESEEEAVSSVEFND